ncbi:hypothetical protein LUZ60_014970 [Juncus effusus]|nr:hypothetical protein LUZ60_014970 [Juncus effusus]
MQVKVMQEKAIDAPEEISIDGISSPIAQHILDFCDDGETVGDLFSITGASRDPPTTSSKPVVSTNNMSDQLASLNDDPDISIAFSNFQSIDPASISALLDSPVRSEPQYDRQSQNQNQNQNQPQMILPLSYAPPNQQFNNGGSGFSIDDEIQMNDRTEAGLQFPMMAPSISSLLPIQQSSQMQGEYNLRLQNSLFPQTITPENNHEMQGYFGNGNNGNGYMSELDGMIEGLSVYNSPCQDQMRRIYSAGDMQMMQGNQNMIGEGNMIGLQEQESSCYRVGRLTQEERKVKIDRYIRKRNERNFKKKIKYACRKTLADSRPRVRGRFAKNDEFEEPRCMQSLSNESFDDDENSPLATVKEDEDALHSSRLMARIGVDTLDFNWSPDTTWSI